MHLIETLEKLEPVFIEAAQLALKMQNEVSHYNKTNTGNELADIVSEADFVVQEFLLKEIVKTDLVNCHLLAEEETLLAGKFNAQGKYYLSIDPIDGTATYAEGGEYFSTIILLHDGKKILYLFDYFPVFKYLHKIVNNAYHTSGKAPDFSLPFETKNTVVYWSGNPETKIPELYNELKSKGIDFKKVLDISNNLDATTLFTQNKVAGIYHEDSNVYDGIVDFSIGLAKGLKIYSGGPNGKFDLTNIQKREIGLYYPGYYLILTL